MTLTRRALRIELMNLLYQYDLYKSENLVFIPNFEHEEVEGFYFQIIDELKSIDEIIESNLFDYSLNRLAYLDRAIIRLAVYEMVKTDTAKEVIIDEAVSLTKIYSNLDDEKQHKFTNRVLDNIANSLKG
ncbi:MAG: transcription antitermination factor NusB [Candidatus Izemoplasmatales bacterium]|jgi:N utilization substance protein B|nr:transcription antitermination factor NusB [Acholeplasmataceae bacterium]MDY0140181.1 transcription antitermination factor NusB [Candidatus Izemoplasmatales bacterium]MDY0338655.1 transcription antitermination factor NusB [Acholeplasmataceae bacterium]